MDLPALCSLLYFKPANPCLSSVASRRRRKLVNQQLLSFISQTDNTPRSSPRSIPCRGQPGSAGCRLSQTADTGAE